VVDEALAVAVEHVGAHGFLAVALERRDARPYIFGCPNIYKSKQ
jgi:hypothetical protein